MTISVDGEDPGLANTALSALVESLDGVGIVVERSMWWPGQGQWYEGHLSAGATVSARRWVVAAASIVDTAETYVLVANATSSPGTITFTTLPDFGIASVSQSFPILPNSRFSISIANLVNAGPPPRSPGCAMGVLVESDGPEIVVERALYTSHGGVTWAAGVDALGTPLP
jgi:hypothetical protein